MRRGTLVRHARVRGSVAKGARLLLMCATVALCLLGAGAGAPARADGLADEAELQFELGVECIKKGDATCALEHFLASNRLVPNRNVVYNIARTYARLGRYADAHRYYVDALEGETDAKTIADIREALAQIAPNVGVLRVETSPPGATIYIDRRDLGSRGRSPRPLALKPGRYQVLVELAGYETAESATVEVGQGQEVPVQLELKRILGTVHVDVEGGPRATVHVGDEKAPSACTAPCDFTLPPGTYLLYFAAEGYQATPRQVLVAARQSVKTSARLKPLSGSLLVEADEKGAVVEVDGRRMGYTPAVIQNVTVGKRAVKVSMRGFRPVERTVEVKAGEQAELGGLRLEPLRQVSAVSRYVEEIDDAPSSLTVIDGQEIRAFGYPTVAEALRGSRGVYLSNDHMYWSAGIRGLGQPNDYGNRLLVLADGHATNDNILNSSYIGTDGRLDLGDVERIELVRGPGSLLYGTGAFSGLVNLVTRPRDEPTSANAAIGTWGNSVAHGRAGGKVNFADNAGMWASVSGSRSDGVELPVELIDPMDGQYEATAHGVGSHRGISTAGHIYWESLEGQWFYHKRTQLSPVGAYATRFDDLGTGYTDERAFGELRFEPKLGDYVDLFTRAHVNHSFFHGYYKSLEGTPDLVEDYYGSWFGGEARVLIKPLDELRILVGGEGQYHPNASMFGTELGPNGEPLEDGSGTYLSEEQSYSFGAVYATLETNPVEWFRLNAGARVDIYSTFGPIVVPRGALIFKPTEGGVLKLMVGRAFRAPSVYELYYNDGGYSQVKAEDPDRGLELNPESVVTSEIEYSQHFLENWTALGAVHSSYVTNIITTVEDSPDVIRYANSESPVLTIGGDVELRRDWRQGWMLAAFYSYERAQYLSPDTPVLEDDPRVAASPEHLAGIKGVVPIIETYFTIAARAALEAPRRINLATQDRTQWAVISDLALSGTAPSYGIHYVVGVYNMFDWRLDLPVVETYASRTLRQAGRTFMAELSATYP